MKPAPRIRFMTALVSVHRGSLLLHAGIPTETVPEGPGQATAQLLPAWPAVHHCRDNPRRAPGTRPEEVRPPRSGVPQAGSLWY